MNSHKGLSEEYVLKVLLKLRLINEDQKKEIFNKKRNIKRKLERLRAVRQASASSRGRPSSRPSPRPGRSLTRK
jgi:hypothetical protein